MVRVCGSWFKPTFMYQMQYGDMIEVQYAAIQSIQHAAGSTKVPPMMRAIPVAGNAKN